MEEINPRCECHKILGGTAKKKPRIFRCAAHSAGITPAFDLSGLPLVRKCVRCSTPFLVMSGQVVGSNRREFCSRRCALLTFTPNPIKEIPIKAGDTFGRLHVIECPESMRAPAITLKIRCLCECGRERYVRASALLAPRKPTRSCGCLGRALRVNSRDGLSKTLEYNSWYSLKYRCCVVSPTSTYQNYGGRGIMVCERWLDPVDGFTNFLSDMGPRPGPEYSIERRDNNGNYEPGNCKWATKKEQANNTRSNHFLELDGERITLGEFARRKGVTIQCILYRLKHKRSLDGPYRPNPRRGIKLGARNAQL
jgi:hypothetical protein